MLFQVVDIVNAGLGVRNKPHPPENGLPRWTLVPDVDQGNRGGCGEMGVMAGLFTLQQFYVSTLCVETIRRTVQIISVVIIHLNSISTILATTNIQN